MIHTYLPTYTYLPIHTYIPTYLCTSLPTVTYLPTYLPPYLQLPTYSYLPTYLPIYSFNLFPVKVEPVLSEIKRTFKDIQLIIVVLQGKSLVYGKNDY